MLAENGVIQYNLLKKLNQLIRQISSHEGFDCNGHLLRVLGLREGGLHHLRGKTRAMRQIFSAAQTIF